MKDLEKQAIIYANKYPTIDGAGFAWLDGAKSEATKEYWQQGMYSEEEFKKAYIQGVMDYCKSSKGLDSFLKTEVNSWFEQNKKK